jgi:hypothetical protein
MKKAKHLLSYSPTHAQVSMCILPDGRACKLDGHTRAYAWEQKLTEGIPTQLDVDVYHCLNEAQRLELYSHFDSPHAVEDSADMISGAFREHNINPTSTLFKTGKCSTAYKLAYAYLNGFKSPNNLDIYEVVGFMKSDIELLDAVAMNTTWFNTGVIAAALISIHKYGNAALDFWHKYSKNEGLKTNAGRDGVDQLREIINGMRSRKVGMGSGAVYEELCGKAIACFEGYRNGKTFGRAPSAFASLEKYLGMKL